MTAMRLMVTRPRPDADAQADALRRGGHEVLVEPLLRVEFLASVELPLEGVQALIATSRNGLRALTQNAALARTGLPPLFAVGGATAAYARELGFTDITEGAGSAAALARLIARRCDPADGPLLHLAGERLAFDLEAALPGFDLRQPVLYRTVRSEALSAAAREAIATGALDGVVLMSLETARAWAALVQAADLAAPARALRCYCLSRQVAEGLAELAPGGSCLRVARLPREDALLALIACEAAH